jgi:2-(1,2-epoxy-1,2-dihydrophenyl)acetyl-CoA isomerase
MSNIVVEVSCGVGTITIDRPQRFNSLDVETARDLRKAGITLVRDPAVRAIVLQGVEGVFCSGADLKYIRSGGEKSDLSYLQPASGTHAPKSGYGAIFKQILEYIHSTISELRRAPKPCIAAVDGIAAAGGFGLAMACDIVFASDRSSFEWAYSKTGLTGAESSTFMLPRLIGLRRSLELLFLNPRIDAQRALELGLVTSVFPLATFENDVRATAERLAAGPTEAYGFAKDMLNQSAGIDRLDVHLDRELENLAWIAEGDNFIEGLEAFFEKRPPVFGAK